jgi:hypothetical protein
VSRCAGKLLRQCHPQALDERVESHSLNLEHLRRNKLSTTEDTEDMEERSRLKESDLRVPRALSGGECD